jgi:YihY family inner membrane protein
LDDPLSSEQILSDPAFFVDSQGEHAIIDEIQPAPKLLSSFCGRIDVTIILPPFCRGVSCRVNSSPMMNKLQNANWLPVRLFSFLLRVLRSFRRNQGLLLSGAVAYYTLLSIIPMSILALIVLSHFLEEQHLIHTLSTYLGMVIPGYAATLTEQVRVFLEHRKAVGIIGFLVMLFFSSIAFSMLENAMSVIFFQRVRIQRRNFLVSAVIPYMYIFAMGLGIVLISLITGAIETLESRQLIIFGLSLNLEGTAVVALYILGILGEMLMLTSIYLVMPVVRVKFRHALIGGITATILWEITRRVLVWYYAVISMVNLIYGSIATVVVALLSIEVVAVILLLGAQVIAELECKPDESAREKRSGFET